MSPKLFVSASAADSGFLGFKLDPQACY